MSAGTEASPTTIVDVPAAGAAAGEIAAAVDAALAGLGSGGAVRVVIASDHPGREALAELFDADPRVGLDPAGAEPSRYDVHVSLPPAARPGPRFFDEVAGLLASGEVSTVEAPVPGRLGRAGASSLAARLPGTTRVRADRRGGGGRRLRVSARRLSLGSAGVRADGPPPRAGLADERAEHLRHRARSATNRARLDRNSQRLTRERMRYQHERARASLLDRRLAEVDTRHRLIRLVRRVVRLALAVPLKLISLASTARSLIRRARRFAIDRLRRRRSPGPR